jgi:hypothetical protein
MSQGRLWSATFGDSLPGAAAGSRPIEVREQVEVVSLMGNVVRGPAGGWKVHAHVVLGRRAGGARAGHLLSARVSPTLALRRLFPDHRSSHVFLSAVPLPLLLARGIQPA